MTEEADTDDDITFKSETLLDLKELLSETLAATNGYNYIFAHILFQNIFATRVIGAAIEPTISAVSKNEIPST